MRGVFRPEPKFLAVFPSLNARCYSVRTEIPVGIFQFKCEAFFGQNQNCWQYFLAIFQSEPEFLAIFINLNARRYSAGTEIPGNSYQFECEVFVSQNQISQFDYEVFVGQDQNSWRRFLVLIRGVFRPGPKFLGIFSQFEYEVLVGQNQNPWRYFPI